MCGYFTILKQSHNNYLLLKDFCYFFLIYMLGGDFMNNVEDYTEKTFKKIKHINEKMVY